MKKMVLAVLSLILCLTFPPMPSGAQNSKRIVRVGYYDYEGFTMKDGDGGMMGYACDYLDEISAYTGWEYEYVPGTVEECLHRLETGEIDLMGGIQYTKERAEHYDYSRFEMGTEHGMLSVLPDHDDVYYGDHESFNDMRIGLIRGTYQSGLMEQYAAQHKFNYEAVWFDSAAGQIAALEQRDVDAVLTGSLQQSTGLKVVAKFLPTPFYFIAKKGNSELLLPLNDAMEKIQTENITFNVKLYSKYYGGNLSRQVAFTKDEAEYIASHKTLRAACNENWAPISYYDSVTGTFKGIGVGILQLIAERGGIKLEFVRAGTEEEALEKLRAGEVDIVCGLPWFQEVQMKEDGIYLTKPYYEVPVALASPLRTDYADIKKVALPENGIALFSYGEELYSEFDITPLPDTVACIEAVKYGKADAVFENVYILDQYARGHQILDPEPLVSTRTLLPVSMGVGEETEPVLRLLLNKLIAQISPEEVNSIVVHNVMVDSRASLWLLLKRYSLPALAVVLFMILCVIYRSRQKIERYAFVDPLTGYSNKTRFMLLAQKTVCNKEPQDYTAVSLDIDKFKLINNMHGFEMGNQILKEISDIVAHELRTGEMFCRESNDRFDILLYSQPEQELRKRLLEMINKISALPKLVGGYFQYTVSCGVYQLKKTDRDIYSAVEWANMARGSAKMHRKNWIAFYEDSMKKKVMEEQEIENRMQDALENGEFKVYYQPKVRLSDEKAAGAEALVRWQPKDGTMLFPDQFIPVFESNGFILKLDLYVFEQVCRQLRIWLDQGFSPCPVSVNLSRVHLNEPNFHIKYAEILKECDVPPELLEIELTESIVSEDMAQMSVVMNELKEIGFKVSVDDFGSGYSSLNLLKALSFDCLKLDKEFLNTASDSERGQRVIKGTKYLAEQLGMVLLAEGVETRYQVDFLISIGCELVQGYYFSKPLPLKEYERYLGFI